MTREAIEALARWALAARGRLRASADHYAACECLACEESRAVDELLSHIGAPAHPHLDAPVVLPADWKNDV